MKRKIFLLIIIMFTANFFLLAEGGILVKINLDGWNLPGLDQFTLVRERRRWNHFLSDPSIKNCYYECYVPKTGKMVVSLPAFWEDIEYRKIPVIKCKTSELLITDLTVYYYKGKPFCFELFNDEEKIQANFLDMDLDGKFETEVVLDPITYFFRFSSEVDEEDRYDKPIGVGKDVDEK